jgi:hypothetical protein
VKLYLLSQNENNGYDTFDSIVVCAESESDAVTIHPNYDWDNRYVWAESFESVSCEYIGEAAHHMERGVVISSFNAG